MTAYSINEAAKDEVRKAIQWYNDEQPGLGDEFSIEFEACLSRILDNPLQYAVEDNGIHYAPLIRFKYIVIYSIRRDKSINIVAVSQTSREPGYWLHRVSS